jgi:hypothetical protein
MVEVEDGRKGDAVDGEGKRGDVEKVYCSGSTAGRDHGLAWLFGEQEDSKGEEGKGTSEAADEEGAPPIGDGPPRHGKAVRSCADEDYWYADEDGPPTEGHSIRESEEDDYMDILERLMRHWAGLAREGKLQWSVVRRRWFGMLGMQRWGGHVLRHGECLWDSEAFRETWVEAEADWQVALDNYGIREGWEEHCNEHGCCGQEENGGEWKVI